MALFLILFLIALAAASALGWVADSRDGADWRPSERGQRVSRTG